jgi:hypothetical protein
MPYSEWLVNNRHLLLTVLEVRDQVTGRANAWWRPISWFIPSPFSLCPHIVERVRGLSRAMSFRRALIPFMSLHPYDLIIFHRTHLLTPSPWGWGFQNMKLGGHKHSDHSRHLNSFAIRDSCFQTVLWWPSAPIRLAKKSSPRTPSVDKEARLLEMGCVGTGKMEDADVGICALRPAVPLCQMDSVEELDSGHPKVTARLL